MSLSTRSLLSLILVCIVLNNLYFCSFNLLKLLFRSVFVFLILVLEKRMVIIFVLVMKIDLVAAPSAWKSLPTHLRSASISSGN